MMNKYAFIFIGTLSLFGNEIALASQLEPKADYINPSPRLYLYSSPDGSHSRQTSKPLALSGPKRYASELNSLTLEAATKRFGPPVVEQSTESQKTFVVWGAGTPNLAKHERYYLEIKFVDKKASEYRIWNEQNREMNWQSTNLNEYRNWNERSGK